MTPEELATLEAVMMPFTQHYSPECIGRQWFDGIDMSLDVFAVVIGPYRDGSWMWRYRDDADVCESEADARKAVEAAHALALEAADEHAEQEARDAGPDALREYRNEREREEMP